MAILVKHTLIHGSGRVSFRRTIPPELRQFVPESPREFKRSLGKRDAGFLSRYEAAANEYEALVAVAQRKRTGTFDRLDGPTIAYLAEAYRAEYLRKDEAAQWTPGNWGGAFGAARWGARERQRWAGLQREAAVAAVETYKARRAAGDVEGLLERWAESARRLAETSGILIDPADTQGLLGLCRALNDAAIAATEDKVRRLDGEDVPTPPALPPLDAPGGPKGPARVPMLSLFDDYAAAQKPTEGVRLEWRRIIERLIEFLGFDDAAKLTEQSLRDWRDHLLKETTNRGTLRDPITVRDKHFVAVRAMLAYGVEEGRLPTNVASAVTVRVPKKAKLRDRSFTAPEANAILGAALGPVSPRMSPEAALARRWVPWLCAYTGARVNEIGQLRKEDVLEVDGVRVLRITPEAGTVKTKEARLVPIHSHLIEQGFLDVVKARSNGPLFYDPSRQRVQKEGSRHFKKVGQKLAEWVRDDLGITDPGIKPNHAWRHLFKTIAREAEIEEATSDAISGHAPNTVGRDYGGVTVKTMSNALARFPRFQLPGV